MLFFTLLFFKKTMRQASLKPFFFNASLFLQKESGAHSNIKKEDKNTLVARDAGHEAQPVRAGRPLPSRDRVLAGARRLQREMGAHGRRLCVPAKGLLLRVHVGRAFVHGHACVH
jgi:hypothetical protein